MKHLITLFWIGVVLSVCAWATPGVQEIICDKDRGYTTSEVHKMNWLVERSVAHVERAGLNRDKLISLYEPDGIPEEVELHRKRSAVK